MVPFEHMAMNNALAVPVLMYHHVSPAPGLVTMTPENFRAQMHYLAANGWHTIGLDDLARFLTGESLPAKSVVVSFDDGYLDNWVHAHPVMAEYGLRGVIFIISGRIGEGAARQHAPPRKVGAVATAPTPSHRDCIQAIQEGRCDDVMLRWSELEAMRAAGSFEFHSHTHTHARWDLTEPDAATRAQRLAEDLEYSRATLRERLGDASSHLCWPQGYYDDAYREVARQIGFTHLYTVRRGACLPTTPHEEIPRIVVKDKPAAWLSRRLAIYRRPWLSNLYTRLHPD